jgi:hypothetical protein
MFYKNTMSQISEQEKRKIERFENGNPAGVIISLLFILAFIIWKVFVFRRAGRSGSGWAVFFSMLMFPFDAITFLWKAKNCIAGDVKVKGLAPNVSM